MELTLERKDKQPDRTIGGVYTEDGILKWFSLEDTDRRLEDGGKKIYGKTAIPRGRYKIELDWSEKRRGLVPFLRSVPGFVAVQIHIGNIPEDTDGCPLFGETYNPVTRQIVNSKNAIKEFYLWLLEKVIETRNNVWLIVK